MATLEQVELLVQQLISEVQQLPTKIKLVADQIVVTGGLSDIDTNLGRVLAGEFRTGNLAEPGRGFSGMRLGWPPFSYSGENWHLVGIDNDTLQVGVRASDGKLLAGGGQVILDATGVDVGAGKVLLTSAGIAAIAGSIGGWVLDETTLTGGVVTLDSAGSIEVPGATLDASGITATAGQIGAIEIDASGLSSSNYVAGLSGFRIDTNGRAEFQDAFVRGNLSSVVFEHKSKQASAGSMGVYKSAATSDNTAYITEDLPGEYMAVFTVVAVEPISVFEVGDRLYVRDGLDEMWGEITAWNWAEGAQVLIYFVRVLSYTKTAFRPGSVIIDYGRTGDGFLEMTADSDLHGPFYRIAKWEDEPSHLIQPTEIVRLGNLNGFLDYASDKYGIAIGSASNYLKYATEDDLLLIRGNISADSGTLGDLTIDGTLTIGPAGQLVSDTIQITQNRISLAAGLADGDDDQILFGVEGNGIWMGGAQWEHAGPDDWRSVFEIENAGPGQRTDKLVASSDDGNTAILTLATYNPGSVGLTPFFSINLSKLVAGNPVAVSTLFMGEDGIAIGGTGNGDNLNVQGNLVVTGTIDGWSKISGKPTTFRPDVVYCSVGRNTNHTIASGVGTAMIFNQVFLESVDMWSAGAPTRLVAPRDGVYQAGASVFYPVAYNTGQRIALYIRMNGTSMIEQTELHANSGVNAYLSLSSKPFYLSGGSYIELFFYHNKGSDIILPGNLAAGELHNYSGWLRSVT